MIKWCYEPILTSLTYNLAFRKNVLFQHCNMWNSPRSPKYQLKSFQSFNNCLFMTMQALSLMNMAFRTTFCEFLFSVRRKINVPRPYISMNLHDWVFMCLHIIFISLTTYIEGQNISKYPLGCLLQEKLAISPPPNKIWNPNDQYLRNCLLFYNKLFFYYSLNVYIIWLS